MTENEIIKRKIVEEYGDVEFEHEPIVRRANRAERRKQKLELSRLERQRKRQISRITRKTFQGNTKGYISEKEALKFMEQLYASK